MRLARAVAMAAAVTVISACGSTVQLQGQVAGGQGGTGPAADGVGPTSAEAVAAGSSELPVSAGTGSWAPSRSGAASAGDSGASTADVSGSGYLRRDAGTPGVTATSIYIGLVYSPNGDAAQAQAGAPGLTNGDQRGEMQAVIDDINAHGGVAGRRLVPVWHPIDALSTQDQSTQEQGVCADFTQDHRIFATNVVGDDVLERCFARAGVLQLLSTGGLNNLNSAYYRRYPHLIDISALNSDRMMRAYAAALVRRDYFAGWNATLGQPGSAPVKVGILTVDDPNFSEPVDHVLIPALRRAGHAPDPGDVYRINPKGDPGSVTAEIASAELHMSQDHVTHVIITDAGGALTVFFTRTSERQRYYPRLGEDTAAGVGVLVASGTVSAKPFNGMLGLGWAPVADLPFAQAANHNTRATVHCLNVLKAHGYTFTSANPQLIALTYCDAFYALAKAINSARGPVTLPSVLAAVEAFGTSYIPAVIPMANITAQQHDGVITGFDMAFDNSCRCLTYLDHGHAIPPR